MITKQVHTVSAPVRRNEMFLYFRIQCFSTTSLIKNVYIVVKHYPKLTISFWLLNNSIEDIWGKLESVIWDVNRDLSYHLSWSVYWEFNLNSLNTSASAILMDSITLVRLSALINKMEIIKVSELLGRLNEGKCFEVSGTGQIC